MARRHYDRKYFDDKKVGELVALAFRSWSIKKMKPVNHRLVSPIESFLKNANHTLSLATYSSVLTAAGVSFGYQNAQATYETLGTFDPEVKKVTRAQYEDIRLRMKRVNATIPKTSIKLFKRMNVFHLREMVDIGKARITDGLDALIPALIVLAWTSFEVLCEELLEKSLDIMPKSLGSLRGRSKGRMLPTWEVGRSGGAPKANILKRPGSRAAIKYRNLKEIRDAYWLAFYKDFQRIDRAIGHRSIDTLYAVRNVLIHTGGRVDKPFLDRVAGLPEFASAVEGNLLQLDFSLVKCLIDPVFDRGINLIAAVNKWITEHPDA